MEVFIISSNIRFSTHDDGEQAWPKRKEILSSILLKYSPFIIGTQEGREPQLRELLTLLPHYKISDNNRVWINERMYPCLFFDDRYVNDIDSGDFWLSETPTIDGSSSFKSMFPRLCTWMLAKIADQFFYIFNTHLDHVHDHTRHAQVRVLCQEIKRINSTNLPIILMGDFNDSPDSETRKNLIQSLPVLRDDWSAQEESTHHPFTGHYPEGSRIDWILHSFNQEIEIKLDKNSKDGIWPSDHFPVISRFTF